VQIVTAHKMGLTTCVCVCVCVGHHFNSFQFYIYLNVVVFNTFPLTVLPDGLLKRLN